MSLNKNKFVNLYYHQGMNYSESISREKGKLASGIKFYVGVDAESIHRYFIHEQFEISQIKFKTGLAMRSCELLHW